MTPEQEAKVWKMNDERNKEETAKHNNVGILFVFALCTGSLFIPYGAVGLWIIWLFYALVAFLTSFALLAIFGSQHSEATDILIESKPTVLGFAALVGHIGIAVFHGWLAIAFMLAINAIILNVLRFKK